MQLLLGSKSPRRRQLLEQMGLSFELVDIDCEETFEGVDAHKVAEYLAVKKNKAFGELQGHDVLLTADTTVLVDQDVLNKPADQAEAIAMLNRLSDRKHQVVTGVCIRNSHKQFAFSEATEVYFRKLSDGEILDYIQTYQPYDKAGSYGIQEGIGVNGIYRLEGCYYNVMGLPCARLYEALVQFNL